MKLSWVGPQALRYQGLLTVCRDHAATTTSFTNRSDLTWVVVRADGTFPPATYPGQSATDAILQATRLDGGTGPLLLPGATVTVWERPSSLRWALDARSSIVTVTMRPIVDEVVDAGVSAATVRASRHSKGWAALIGCSKAVHDVSSSSTGIASGDAIVDAVLGVSGTLSCSSLIAAAVRERGGFWPDSVGVQRVSSILDNAAWFKRVSAVDDLIDVLGQLVGRV